VGGWRGVSVGGGSVGSIGVRVGSTGAADSIAAVAVGGASSIGLDAHPIKPIAIRPSTQIVLRRIVSIDMQRLYHEWQ
jgi:hypothetical protein